MGMIGIEMNEGCQALDFLHEIPLNLIVIELEIMHV
jgi:hypothetical protein